MASPNKNNDKLKFKKFDAINTYKVNEDMSVSLNNTLSSACVLGLRKPTSDMRLVDDNDKDAQGDSYVLVRCNTSGMIGGMFCLLVNDKGYLYVSEKGKKDEASTFHVSTNVVVKLSKLDGDLVHKAVEVWASRFASDQG